MITATYLREILSYEPEAGLFRWRARRSNVKVGQIAGKTLPTGYIHIRIDGRTYYAHRLAYLYMTGEWPPHQIDHVDRNTKDNRWCNLRPATQSQNNANRAANSGAQLKGVSPTRSKTRPWAAFIKESGRTVYLGAFTTPEQASAAYMQAARRVHGEFARAA